MKQWITHPYFYGVALCVIALGTFTGCAREQLLADLTVQWKVNETHYQTDTQAIKVILDGLAKNQDEFQELSNPDVLNSDVFPQPKIEHKSTNTLTITTKISNAQRTRMRALLPENDPQRDKIPGLSILKYKGSTANGMISFQCRAYVSMDVKTEAYSVEEIQEIMRSLIMLPSGYLGYPDSYETHYPSKNYLEIEG